MADHEPERPLATVAQAVTPVGEVGALARSMADAYHRMIVFYRQQCGLSAAEADEKARDLASPDGMEERRGNVEPHLVSNWQLIRLQEHDPAAALAWWEEIKAAAREELASGIRGADVATHSPEPWERAQFLAVRTALIDEWQPRGGLELMLIDTLAQAQTSYLYWLDRLNSQAGSEGRTEDEKMKRDGYWRPPTIGVAETLDQSAAMVDRFNRLMLRTLRDLRRYSPAVIVQRAGQVNVGAQQVNIGQGRDE